MIEPPLLRTVGLTKDFRLSGGFGRKDLVLRAVDSVSIEIEPRRTLGLVGESGSGKSTLGFTIARYHEPTAGRIEFGGRDIARASRRELKGVYRRLQVVFQNPLTSLNPQLSIGQTLGEPFEIHGVGSRRDRSGRVARLLQRVGLRPADMSRFPHELSGGQRQRIAIARAIALEPSLVIADEPTSSLDVSVQAQIVNLMQDLQAQIGMSYLFITHNLPLVRHVSHEVAVLYLGRVVEEGPTREVFDAPLHPYTVALVRSRRRDPGGGHVLKGEIPSALAPPSGCCFRTRCPIAKPVCAVETPPLRDVRPGRRVACHFPGEAR